MSSGKRSEYIYIYICVCVCVEYIDEEANRREREGGRKEEDGKECDDTHGERMQGGRMERRADGGDRTRKTSRR